MADISIEIMEERLLAIEKRIFGKAEKDADYPKDTSKIVDAVHAITTQLSAATAGRSRIEDIFRKLGELEQYLDPDYVDQLLMSSSAKADVVIADEPTLLENVALLEKVQNASPVLDSEHIKAVPSLQNKLYSLCKIHLTQQDETAELTDDVKALIAHYNSIITLLSKQFIYWDELVTQLELASKPNTGENN